MTPISQLQTFLQTTDFQTLLQEIYIDSSLLDYQQKRYSRALSVYTEKFGASQESEVAVFSAPGRSEIGGNHTDHQHGKVLAASINLDAIAVVGLLDAPEVKVISGDSDLICISLEHLSKEKDDDSHSGVDTLRHAVDLSYFDILELRTSGEGSRYMVVKPSHHSQASCKARESMA